MSYIWKEAETEAFKTLMTGEDILSYKEMAARLTEIFQRPFSKNMCIGKAHRLGIKARVKEKRGGFELSRRVVNLARVRALSAPIEPLPEDFPMDPTDKVTFDQLQPGCCKFPFGEHPNLLFCGAPQQEDSPYCATHHALTRINPMRQRLRWSKPSYALR